MTAPGNGGYSRQPRRNPLRVNAWWDTLQLVDERREPPRVQWGLHVCAPAGSKAAPWLAAYPVAERRRAGTA